jgi:uncharacterized membrane protein YsdA (DUF1294 family)
MINRFLSIGYDKFLAKNQKRRISERTLVLYFLGNNWFRNCNATFRHKKKAIYGSFVTCYFTNWTAFFWSIYFES